MPVIQASSWLLVRLRTHAKSHYIRKDPLVETALLTCDYLMACWIGIFNVARPLYIIIMKFCKGYGMNNTGISELDTSLTGIKLLFGSDCFNVVASIRATICLFSFLLILTFIFSQLSFDLYTFRSDIISNKQLMPWIRLWRNVIKI